MDNTQVDLVFEVGFKRSPIDTPTLMLSGQFQGCHARGAECGDRIHFQVQHESMNQQEMLPTTNLQLLM
jgi:hypothetical protein